MMWHAGFLLCLAAAAHGIASRCPHGRNALSKKNNDFYGVDSYLRKYRFPLAPPKDNWYYKHFKISYRERFFGSATAFVFITDGFHFWQWVMIKSLCGGIAILSPTPIVTFFLLWFVWTVWFQVTYLGFKK